MLDSHSCHFINGPKYTFIFLMSHIYSNILSFEKDFKCNHYMSSHFEVLEYLL